MEDVAALGSRFLAISPTSSPVDFVQAASTQIPLLLTWSPGWFVFTSMHIAHLVIEICWEAVEKLLCLDSQHLCRIMPSGSKRLHMPSNPSIQINLPDQASPCHRLAPICIKVPTEWSSNECIWMSSRTQTNDIVTNESTNLYIYILYHNIKIIALVKWFICRSWRVVARLTNRLLPATRSAES